MDRSKIAIPVDRQLLAKLDRLSKDRKYPSRIRAVQEKLLSLERSRLARECAKLDRIKEQRIAEVGVNEDLESSTVVSHGRSLEKTRKARVVERLHPFLPFTPSPLLLKGLAISYRDHL